MKAKILSVLLLVAILTLSIAACGNDATPTPQPQPDTTQTEQTPQETPESVSDAPQEIGTGETMFVLSVTDDTGEELFWNVHTNQATVGAALLEVGLISGDESEWGLMVSHVNGLRADFMEDDAWWAFLVDGEMSMVGVDSTDVEAGVTYAFVFTPN